MFIGRFLRRAHQPDDGPGSLVTGVQVASGPASQVLSSAELDDEPMSHSASPNTSRAHPAMAPIKVRFFISVSPFVPGDVLTPEPHIRARLARCR